MTGSALFNTGPAAGHGVSWCRRGARPALDRSALARHGPADGFMLVVPLPAGSYP
jgi:hypothetical protein